MEKKERIDKNIYNKFIQSIHIESMNLINLSIKSSGDDTDGREQLFVDLKFQNEKYDFNNNELVVNPKFILKVSKMKDNDKVIVFEIRFEYKLQYSVEGFDEIAEDYLQLFVNRNVPVNIWPYARELISSMTTRMGYSALIIEPLKG